MTLLHKAPWFLLAAALILLPAAYAQDAPLTHDDHAEVIDGLIDLLETHYVLPATAEQLRARLAHGDKTSPEAADTTLAAYAGTYGIRTITVDDGALHLQRNDVEESHMDAEGRLVLAPKLKLIPLGEDTFSIEQVPEARVAFGRDAEGRIVELRVLNRQGQWEVTPRDDAP